MTTEEPFKLEREVFGLKISIFDDYSFKNDKDEIINVKRGIKIGTQRVTAAQTAALKYLLTDDKEFLDQLGSRLAEEKKAMERATL